MSLENQLKSLLSQINDFKATADNSLPQNTFYLNEKEILCCEREYGVSRFPYDASGLVVWAKSNGHIDAYESTFTIFKELDFTEDSTVSFVGGVKNADGGFFPVALFDCNRQLFENIKIDRYVVYSFKYVYYIADTPDVAFAVRLHVSDDKHIHFAYTALNKTDKPQNIYMMSCFDAWLFYRNVGGVYDIMNRFGKVYENKNFLLRSYEDCMVVARSSFGEAADKEYITANKSDVLGPAGRLINNSPALKKGELLDEHKASNSIDVPVSADCAQYTLSPGGSVRREYELSYFHTLKEAEAVLDAKPDIQKIDAELETAESVEISKFETLKVRFKDFKGNINPNVLNKFVRNIQKQVSFCALGKNYFGPMIGIRDVMQQLETSLIWQPKESRRQFVTALNYILEDGRPPRQFSVPDDANALPALDLRKFIDQGVWIISTLYTYLTYTDDWSILDEKCSYYIVDENNTKVIAKSETVDTVLDHVVKVMDYLCRNVDSETGCLHMLYGDWNDALDALGKTEDETKEFGTGVSVMASLQLYQNCSEICEILAHTGKYTEKIEQYKAVANELTKGLHKYAVDTNDEGVRRIIHGWGDKMSYKIGSWLDPDGVTRTSSTANSFWAISGMLKNDPSLKETIMSAYKSLDSKYGIMTFDKAFSKDMRKYVGRISQITAGTYENAGTYVHATMFAVMALFAMGESREAWHQFELGTVLSHPDCNKSPFAMPNSYFKSDEWCIDGQSFADWYTGSGTVFIKSLIKFGFGICPTLDGLTVQTAATMPCDNATLDIIVKGRPITLKYTFNNTGARKYLVNCKEVSAEYDDLMKTGRLFVKTEDITDNMVIEVID